VRNKSGVEGTVHSESLRAAKLGECRGVWCRVDDVDGKIKWGLGGATRTTCCCGEGILAIGMTFVRANTYGLYVH